MPVTGVFHNILTPHSSALATKRSCSSGRRNPIPCPSGKSPHTRMFSCAKQMPRNRNPSAGLISTPNARSAANASGIIPSPHGFSIGGAAPSASVTSSPCWRAAMAVASPAGPPPTTNTSVLSPEQTTQPPFSTLVSNSRQLGTTQSLLNKCPAHVLPLLLRIAASVLRPSPRVPL